MSETPRNDLMRDSPAWQRLRDGIPTEIADYHLRRQFHDYGNIITILVGELERALDEIDRLHLRINRRADDHEALKNELFHPKTGHFAEAKKDVDAKFGKFTGPLFALLGSVMAGLIMLVATRLTGG